MVLFDIRPPRDFKLTKAPEGKYVIRKAEIRLMALVKDSRGKKVYLINITCSVERGGKRVGRGKEE